MWIVCAHRPLRLSGWSQDIPTGHLIVLFGPCILKPVFVFLGPDRPAIQAVVDVGFWQHQLGFYQEDPRGLHDEFVCVRTQSTRRHRILGVGCLHELRIVQVVLVVHVDLAVPAVLLALLGLLWSLARK